MVSYDRPVDRPAPAPDRTLILTARIPPILWTRMSNGEQGTYGIGHR